jgi:hypothetical protein
MRILPDESAWSPYPQGKVEPEVTPKAPDPYENPYVEKSPQLRMYQAYNSSNSFEDLKRDYRSKFPYGRF